MLLDALNMTQQQKNPLQALFQTAIDHHQEGRLAEAEKLYREILIQAPDAAIIHVNLAMIYTDQQPDLAVKHYSTAARLQPEDPDILFNLGLILKKMGRLNQAKSRFRQGLALSPEDFELHYNLALTLQAMNKIDRAIISYQDSLNINHQYGPALNNLGFLYHKQGQNKEAIHCYSRLVEIDHHAESARHMLAALKGETPDSAPEDYVKDVFDNYSAGYDHSLVKKLGYQTPKLLREMVLKQGKLFTNGLDLGCGTGLSGIAFRDLTQRLTGIDLSAGMLAQAKRKNIYDELHQSSINDFLESTGQRFDLFIATDVFVYLGDLAPVFYSICQCAADSAQLLFSTEETEEGFTLKNTGRYGHALSYIQELAAQHRLTIQQWQSTNIRKEKGKWIKGNLFVMGMKKSA